MTRQRREDEALLTKFQKKVENLKDKEETNAQVMASLEEENKMLKLNALKKRVVGDKGLQKEVDTLEREVLEDLGKRTIEIKRLGLQLKKSKLETVKANKVIGELNSKMKLREEEVHLLEEKILSLQRSIKWAHQEVPHRAREGRRLAARAPAERPPDRAAAQTAEGGGRARAARKGNAGHRKDNPRKDGLGD